MKPRHTRGEGIPIEAASISLTCGHIYGIFSWFLIDWDGLPPPRQQCHPAENGTELYMKGSGSRRALLRGLCFSLCLPVPTLSSHFAFQQYWTATCKLNKLFPPLICFWPWCVSQQQQGQLELSHGEEPKKSTHKSKVEVKKELCRKYTKKHPRFLI